MDDAVMVTGGLGMVGSHVCRALVAAGHRPLVYDAGGDTATSNRKPRRGTVRTMRLS